MTVEQIQAYMQQYPMSDADYGAYQQANGLSNVNIAAAQPQGSSGATLGPAITDPAVLANIADQVTFIQPAKNGVEGDKDWENYFRQGLATPGGGMPGFNTQQQDHDRVQQQRVIQELQAQAAGNMNSQAQQQLGQGYQQARAQQSSLGSSIRGQSAGAAQRGIMQGQQGLQRGFAGDQQMLKLQEQQAAQQALQQMYAQQYGQDVSQANSMAQGALQGASLEQAMKQFYLQGLTGQAIGNAQYGGEFNRVQAGMDLEAKNLIDQQNQRLASAGGAGAGTLAELAKYKPSNTNSGYRQVNGQDSIVPIDDK